MSEAITNESHQTLTTTTTFDITVLQRKFYFIPYYFILWYNCISKLLSLYGQIVWMIDLYFSNYNWGFLRFFSGLLRAVARDIFGTPIACEVIKNGEISLVDETKRYYTDFKVTWEASKNDPSLSPVVEKQLANCQILHTSISLGSLCNIFPFHVIFDSQMRLKQCGNYISRQIKSFTDNNKIDITKMFHLLHPRMPFTFPNLRLFINAAYILETVEEYCDDDEQPILQQQASLISLESRISNRNKKQSTTNWQSRTTNDGAINHATLILKGMPIISFNC